MDDEMVPAGTARARRWPLTGSTGGRAPGAVAPSRRRDATALAWLARLVGLVDLVSVLTPELSSRLHLVNELLSGLVQSAAGATTLLVGVLLLLIGSALRRRKRRAWQLAVGLLALSVVTHLAKGLDVEESVLSLVLLVLLVLRRGSFTARPDPRSRAAALGVGMVMAAASLGLGLLLVLSQLRHVRGPHGPDRVVSEVLHDLVGLQGPLDFTSDRAADLVSFALGALGALTVVLVVYLALRPAGSRAFMSAADEATVRTLLDRYGERDSLGWFALRRDKCVLFDPSRQACIAYRVVRGVMLASGDPVGEPGAWPGAIATFLAEAAAHAWIPAVMGCSTDGGTAWARAGLQALELGDEAVVNVADFDLVGRSMRGVRQTVAKVDRAGWTSRVRRLSELDDDEKALVRAQAARWRTAETEHGFSMALGRFGEPADDRCVLVTAERDGQLGAFLHFVPWGDDGISLDLMRRDRDADNGLNEFLITAALRAGDQLGVRRVSLNFAVFRSALARGEQLGAGPVLRAWYRVLLVASRWFQIESLYRFNAKFQPQWVPRYVCYPTARDLPRIVVSALEAEAFVVWPRPSLARVATALRQRGRPSQVAEDPAG